jgi:His-Xaa-Ser repeat protein HxsA
MKRKFKTTLTLFLSGLPFGGTDAKSLPHEKPSAAPADPIDPVSLRPLNLPGENLFAAHRSHSSHASHRSGSGGGYSSPTPKQPAAPAEPGGSSPSPRRAPSSSSNLAPEGSAQPTDPGRAAPVSPKPAAPRTPTFSTEEKRKLQVMRVQIQLTSLGLYTGAVNGTLDDATKEAIKRFQTVKGIEANGLMTTQTLNALGVPAVQ